ncbi:MAG: calcium-binding protein [Pseudomonas sp.]|uniref:calcium-binding protein n=1 Tax=Pseudomonas sp. TaxID=306 RepID=UPI00339AE606
MKQFIAGADTWVSQDTKVKFVLSGDDLLVLYGDNDSILIRNYQPGRLGIHLDQSDLLHPFSNGALSTTGGTDNPDHLEGSAAANRLLGFQGVDRLFGYAGDDQLFAYNAGAFGPANTPTWSEGITGDWLDGGKGNDGLLGSDGIDGLFGGGGADTLIAGGGDDVIFADGVTTNLQHNLSLEHFHVPIGNDSQRFVLVSGLIGGPGEGEHGNDHVIAGDGNDFVDGYFGDDYLEGNAGEDYISGSADDDILLGGANNDTLLGDGFDGEAPDKPNLRLPGSFHGDDLLIGGEGEDRLYGNGGHDRLFGGAGLDILFGDDQTTPGQFHGNDSLDGGEQNDTLVGMGGQDWLSGGDGDDALDGDLLELDGSWHGADVLQGGSGNDTLYGQGGGDSLSGGAGNDRLEGDNQELGSAYQGQDDLEGGADDDQLWGGGKNDTLRGGSGLDYLDGGRDDDRLAGQAGADTLMGDQGNDSLIGGADDDQLNGGEGDDRYEFAQGDGNDTLEDESGSNSVLFGPGISRDSLTFQRSFSLEGTAYLTVNYGASDQLHILKGQEGTISRFDFADGSSLALSEALAELGGVSLFATDAGGLLSGSEDADVLIGGIGADILVALGGDDKLYGADNDDRLDGGAGLDTLRGGAGQDVLAGGADQDALSGDLGDDHLNGDEGDDSLEGGAGNDLLSGGLGNDQLEGGAGADTLEGGEGVDTYGLEQHLGQDLVRDSQGEYSLLRLVDSFATADLMARQEGQDILIEHQDGSHGIRLEGAAASNWRVIDGEGAELSMDAFLGGLSLQRSPGFWERRFQRDVRREVQEQYLRNGLVLEGDGLYHRHERGDSSERDTGYSMTFIAETGERRVARSEVSTSSSVVVSRSRLSGAPGSTSSLLTPGASGAGNYVTAADLGRLREVQGGEYEASVEYMAPVYSSVESSLLLGMFSGSASGVSTTSPGIVSTPTPYTKETTTILEQYKIATGLDDGGLYSVGSGNMFHGGSGQDIVLGESGASLAVFLDGGSGDDAVVGGEGNDILLGGQGNDLLSGGSGQDTYLFRNGEGVDIVNDLPLPQYAYSDFLFCYKPEVGSSVADEVVLPDEATTENLQLAWGSVLAEVTTGKAEWFEPSLDPGFQPELVPFFTASQEQPPIRAFRQCITLDIAWGTGQMIRVVMPPPGSPAGFGIEQYRFADGSTWSLTQLLARGNLGAPPDIAHSNQLLRSEDARDPESWRVADLGLLLNYALPLQGMYGDDTLLGGERDDFLLGSEGNDSLEGGEGQDFLDGGAGEDELNAGAGDDVLDGGAGADRMVGGLGDDHFRVDSIADTVIEGADQGTDTVSASISYTLVHAEHLFLLGTADLDGAGNEADNKLRGNDGNNKLLGRAGDDSLSGGAGQDRLDGGEGQDELFGGEGNDLLLGNVGNDRLGGSDGDDRLLGDEGDDTLSGDAGNDTLSGGLDADTYWFDRGAGQDLIDNLDAGSGGTDGIEFAEGILAEEVVLTRAADDLLLSIKDSTDSIRVSQYFTGGVASDATLEEIRFADGTRWGRDYVEAAVAPPQPANLATVESSSSRTLGAGEGDLLLLGEAAIDGTGNAFNNRLTGNRANNTLNGRAGADTLIGGLGDDTYALDSRLDRVVEFQDEGIDLVKATVDHSLGEHLEQLMLLGDAVEGIGNGLDNQLKGTAGANRLSGLAGNDYLHGGVGDDLLLGGEGDDDLHGGDGQDSLEGGAGNDALTGGAGSDTYRFGRGAGQDSVRNYDNGLDVVDQLLFGEAIEVEDLWFSRSGNHLQVDLLGSDDRVTFSEWYSGSSGYFHLDQFKTADGQMLLDAQVQNLVNAMAAFGVPVGGEVNLSGSQREQLNGVIAASWQ